MRYMFILLLLSLCVFSVADAAQDNDALSASDSHNRSSDSNNGVQDIGDHLRRHQAPWYESDGDRLHRLSRRREKKASDTNRDSSWDHTFMDIVRVLIYVGIAALIIGLLVMLVPKILQRTPTSASRPRKAHDVTALRLQDLPFQADSTVNQSTPQMMLDDALLHKNWSAVVIACYILLLTELHQAQVIAVRAGKTNRVYVREAISLPAHYHGMLDDCVQLCERHFFGQQQMTHAQAQRAEHALHALRAHLAQQRYVYTAGRSVTAESQTGTDTGTRAGTDTGAAHAS